MIFGFLHKETKLRTLTFSNPFIKVLLFEENYNFWVVKKETSFTYLDVSDFIQTQ